MTYRALVPRSVPSHPLFEEFSKSLAAEGGIGGRTTFIHFTDATGLEGITGVTARTLSSGRSVTVGPPNFGVGFHFLSRHLGTYKLDLIPWTTKRRI